MRTLRTQAEAYALLAKGERDPMKYSRQKRAAQAAHRRADKLEREMEEENDG